MSEPLTDPLALVMLDAFRRQPYEPAHLGALRDRLWEIGREDLIGMMAYYDEGYVESMKMCKRTMTRSRFRIRLRHFQQALDVILSVRREAGTPQGG